MQSARRYWRRRRRHWRRSKRSAKLRSNRAKSQPSASACLRVQLWLCVPVPVPVPVPVICSCCVLGCAMTRWHRRWSKFQPTIAEEEVVKALAGNSQGSARKVFDKVVDGLYAKYKGDRRLVKDLLHEANLEVGPATKYEAFVAALSKYEADNPPAAKVEDEGAVPTPKDADGDADMASGDADAAATNGAAKALPFAAALARAPENVKLVFEELHAVAVEEAERQAKKLARRKGRFEDLLTEYFYRSDHVGTSWADAKGQLRSHSAYKDLYRYPEEREAVFAAHMKKLADACSAVAPAAAVAAEPVAADAAAAKGDADAGAGAADAAPAEGGEARTRGAKTKRSDSTEEGEAGADAGPRRSKRARRTPQ